MLFAVATLMTLVCLAGWFSAHRTTQKRERAFRARYPSFEDFRQAVDADRIREMRDSKGDVAGVREVRRDFPDVSLVNAKRYVDELG